MSKAKSKAEQKVKIGTEIGNVGVQVDFLAIANDAIRDLTFPYSIGTFNRMSRNSVIGATLSAVNTIASQVEFYIDSFDESVEHKERRDFLEQVLFKDMETSFDQVIRDALTMTKHGFSVLEKVYRFRRYKKGSIYNDGKVGIKYLPIRAQSSIEGFIFDDSNRKLDHFVQRPVGATAFNVRNTECIKIKADRAMLFRVNSTGLNPYGQSPLADAYTSWRVLERLQDIETASANRNLNGIPHLSAPSEVLDEDEDDPESLKRVRKMKAGLSAISSGNQSYILTPSDKYGQEEGGGSQYGFNLVTGSSSHLTALSGIIQRYSNETFQTMCADILTLDNGQGGSTSLTSNKQTMLNMFVEARLKEILDVLNNDLIPDLWEKNLWDKTKLPKIKHGRIEKVSLEVLAKAVQQLMATNSIPLTVENINYLMEVFGFPTRLPKDTSREELLEILGFGLEMQSRSGDGMAKGTVGEGTAKKLSGTDKNAQNLDKEA